MAEEILETVGVVPAEVEETVIEEQIDTPIVEETIEEVAKPKKGKKEKAIIDTPIVEEVSTANEDGFIPNQIVSMEDYFKFLSEKRLEEK